MNFNRILNFLKYKIQSEITFKESHMKNILCYSVDLSLCRNSWCHVQNHPSHKLNQQYSVYILYGNVRNERISFGNKHIMYWELCTCEHLLDQRKSMETHPFSDLCALLTFAFHSTLTIEPKEATRFSWFSLPERFNCCNFLWRMCTLFRTRRSFSILVET